MKQLPILLVTAVILTYHRYGAYASSKELAEGNAVSTIGDDTGGKTSTRSGMSFFSSSSSSGPGFWTSMFSGPETGGSVVSFSNKPFSTGGVHVSKSESSSSGTNQIQSHFVHNFASDPDDDDVAQTGTFVSEEDEEVMPSKGRAQSSANAGARTRLLGLGGSGSRSGLLGLGLGLL